MSTPARVPRNLLSQSGDPAGPNLLAGDIYYNSTAKTIRIYDGSAWVDLVNDETAQSVAGAKTWTSAQTIQPGTNVASLTVRAGSADDTAVWVTNNAGSGAAWLRAFSSGIETIAVAPSGLTGATSASRYVGATASGAPASGTFVTGDYIIAQNGAIHICTAGGSPGTWAAVGASPSYATTAELANVSAAAESAGASATVARGDHKHDIDTATAVALTGSSASAGTSDNLAHADHQHGLTFGSTAIAFTADGTSASLRMPHGTAPSAPTNGDLWTTTSGLFARINGVTSGPIETLIPFTFSVPGSIGVHTGRLRLYAEYTMTIVSVRASVNLAPTGTSLICDVNKNGTTIYTTQGNRPTVAISGFTATANSPDVTSLAAGDYITVDVDQVGSTVAGENLTVQVLARRTG